MSGSRHRSTQTMEYYSALKKQMRFWAKYRHGGRKLKYINWVKEASLKRSHTVWFRLYDILEKQNYEDRKKISGCQGLVGREKGIGKKCGFLGQWHCFVRYHNGGYLSFYVCQNSYNTQHQGWTVSVTLGLWVKMMNWGRFTDDNKCTSVVQEVDSGGSGAPEGQGYGGVLCTFRSVLLWTALKLL